MATLPHRARNTDRFELNRSSWQAAGLVGWWPLGAYPNGRDKSLFANHGAWDNSINTDVPTPASFQQRRALEFSGNGKGWGGDKDYLTVPHHENYNITGNMTITMWATINTPPAGHGWYTLLSRNDFGDYTSPYSIVWFSATKKYSLYIGSGSGATQVGTVNNATTYEKWDFITARITGTDMILFVNGISGDTAVTFSGSRQTNTRPMRIGGSIYGDPAGDGTYNHGGHIDDVRLYNRALSDAEMSTVYNQTRDGGYGDLAVLPTRRIGIDPLLFPPGGIIGTASVSPVTAAWSTPAVTATHSIVISASASPVAAAWSVPAVTATYATAPSASVSPVTAAWGVPAVTATRTAVFSASASPVTTTWSTPAVTATHATSHSASASPVAAAWSTTATTATYAVVIAASASPVTAAWSVPSMTATTSAVALPTVFYSTRGLSTVSMAALGTANAEAELVGAGGVITLVKGK